jgi:hypothetical protein
MTADAGLGYTARYIPLARGTHAVLYEPRAMGHRPRIGVLVCHPSATSLNHVATRQLAQRGMIVLAVDTPYSNLAHHAQIWEDVPPHVGLGVSWLRGNTNVERIVLLGHSMAGPLMAFYQNLAENRLADLPAADAVILVDSHVGDAAATLTNIDPSVVDESNPGVRDPELDMFSAANGFDPAGARYPREFLARFFAAQSERFARLVKRATARLSAIAAGQGMYLDDEPFPFHCGNARIWRADLSLLAATRQPRLLLHADGSRTEQIVHSMRPPSAAPSANTPPANQDGSRTYATGMYGVSVRQFLSTHAIRTTANYAITESSIDGIVWESSKTSTIPNIRGVTVPLLILAMTGHYFVAPDEFIYECAASSDKQLAYVEGASHALTPCRDCEQFAGQYGDTVKTAFDHMGAWLNERFASG